ncbi:unnamed protein product [Parajaminaea phylloscopi]
MPDYTSKMPTSTYPSAEDQSPKRTCSMDDDMTPSGSSSPTCAASRASCEETDNHKHAHSNKQGEPINIDWQNHDPEHPWNWPEDRKWLSLLVAVLFNSSTAMNATGYATTTEGAANDLNVSETAYLTGSTAYLVPVAIAPLFLAPLSEVFGRRWVCLIAVFIYTTMFIPHAVSTSMTCIIVPRIIQGITGSVGNTMVGGFVADMWPKASRSLPMSVFVLTVLMSQAVGSAASAWTAANPNMGWRWVFWWQGLVAFATFLVMIVLLPETRAEVLLEARARRLTRETGLAHVTAQSSHSVSLLRTIGRNCTRPLVFLFTEPIVTALALWSGFIWGVVFLSLRSVKYTFAVYGLSSTIKSTILLSYGAGALLGFISNLHQTALYRKALKRSCGGRVPPEMRLFWCMPAALFTCAGLFWYAWAAHPQIPVVVPILGLILFAWGTYIIYLSTLVYLADAYETYSSSGIACQALVRNLTAGVLSAVADPIYTAMPAATASSILAAIAGLLGLAPFVLYFWGHKLRAMSKVTSQLAREQDEKEAQSSTVTCGTRIQTQAQEEGNHGEATKASCQEVTQA